MTAMSFFSLSRRLLLAVLIAGHSLVATHAQPPAPTVPYEPSVGQQGKDVVWVPTGETLVQKMLDLANVTATDYVIDLGSGDGRTVIAAEKRAEEAGVADRATFEKADLFESDFSKATVITMFLLPSINEKLRPQLLDLAPGTRIVSNTFTMGPWEADEQATVTDCESWCTALLWIVPAKVAGSWATPDGQLVLEQEFQKVSGTLAGAEISGGRLRGDTVIFTANGSTYTGRVAGDSIAFAISGARSTSWNAKKE
jgi:hypothetical protein